MAPELGYIRPKDQAEAKSVEEVYTNKIWEALKIFDIHNDGKITPAETSNPQALENLATAVKDGKVDPDLAEQIDTVVSNIYADKVKAEVNRLQANGEDKAQVDPDKVLTSITREDVLIEANKVMYDKSGIERIKETFHEHFQKLLGCKGNDSQLQNIDGQVDAQLKEMVQKVDKHKDGNLTFGELMENNGGSLKPQIIIRIPDKDEIKERTSSSFSS